MSTRLVLSVFKGVDEGTLLSCAKNVAERFGGSLLLDAGEGKRDDIFSHHAGSVHTLFANADATYLYFRHIAKELSLSWMQLRIQESALWDFSLYRGDEHLDNFSTLPEYWDREYQAWIATQRGKPMVLAEVWNVPLVSIERYFLPWGMERVDGTTYRTLRRGKAYDADKHEYGDCWQMLDFLRVLGGSHPLEPENNSRKHKFQCPSPQAMGAPTPRKISKWRRWWNRLLGKKNTN